MSFFLSLGVFLCLFFSLWEFSWNFLWCFGRPGPSNVRVFALGLSCETPAAKNTDNVVCPAPSVLLCCFISVCFGFLPCVVFLCSWSPGSPSAPPPPWSLTLWKGQRRGRGPKMAKIHYGVQTSLNMPQGLTSPTQQLNNALVG